MRLWSAVFHTTDSAKEVRGGVKVKTANLDPAGKIAYPCPKPCDGSENRAIRLPISGVPTRNEQPHGTSWVNAKRQSSFIS